MSESEIIITDEYLESQGLSKNFPERFWSKVNKTDSCWLWGAGCDTAGYGLIRRGEKRGTITTHRASWIINKGPVPKGLCVLHNCPNGDNRKCINPNHLWLGTADENMKDRNSKNRQAKGEKIGNSKLTEDAINEIRALSKIISGRKIAKLFSVGKTTIQEVLKRRSWNHV
jgi:hypothetical protein